MASRKESREWRQGTVAKRGAGRGLERWEPPALERSEERTGLLDRGETFSGDGDGDVLSGLPFPFLPHSHRFGMVRQFWKDFIFGQATNTVMLRNEVTPVPDGALLDAKAGSSSEWTERRLAR